MALSTDSTLVFLTYNDKVLLMLKDNRIQASEQNLWSFIGGNRRNNESCEQTCLREVLDKTNLKLDSLNLLTKLSYNSKKLFIYHAILTSHHLNDIKRNEGQNLDFFTLPEVEKLTLEETVKLFLSNHKSTIQGLLHN